MTPEQRAELLNRLWERLLRALTRRLERLERRLREDGDDDPE